LPEIAAKAGEDRGWLSRFRRSPRARAAAGLFGALAVALLVFLALFDWNWLRGPVAGLASARLQRPVAIDGNLRVKLLSWSPTASLERLRIGQPSWAPKGDMAQIDRLTVSIRLPSLLKGQVVLPLLAIDRPKLDLLRDAQGRANWEFGPRRAGAAPMKLPPIQTFVVTGGRLTLRDLVRKLEFEGTVDARERASAAYAQGFHLTGKGSLNRNPFLMDVTGGPLLNVRADRPYPFDLELTAGPTKVSAKGAVAKPFDLGRIDATLTVQGKDLANLYELTGVALPNTPPYRISGQLHRYGKRYDYKAFSGVVGASDLSGDLGADYSTGRLYLTGAVTSRRLDFRDLASVFGLPGASRAAAPDQKVALRAQEAEGRLLPDAPLQVDRLRSMDADVRYQAATVLAPNLPLKAVSVYAALSKGVLTLAPVSFELPQGRLSGTARIDARPDIPASAVDFRLTNARIEDFLQKTEGPKPVEGLMLARIKLAGRGVSVRKAAANADGAATFVVPQGQIRQAFAELLGIDATKGLFLLLAKDQQPTPLRCAVADFRVQNGVMRAQDIVLDTGVVSVLGEGTVSLATERYDLAFKGKPKKLRAVRVNAPITVKGTLSKPSFGVDAGAAITQAGVGVALATVLTPLAAILPFVDAGLAKDANCTALMAEAQTTPAPVKAPPKAALAAAREAAAKKKKGS
jgi:uncharacterized protein involved in outer membrane biogenesis